MNLKHTHFKHILKGQSLDLKNRTRYIVKSYHPCMIESMEPGHIYFIVLFAEVLTRVMRLGLESDYFCDL